MNEYKAIVIEKLGGVDGMSDEDKHVIEEYAIAYEYLLGDKQDAAIETSEPLLVRAFALCLDWRDTRKLYDFISNLDIKTVENWLGNYEVNSYILERALVSYIVRNKIYVGHTPYILKSRKLKLTLACMELYNSEVDMCMMSIIDDTRYIYKGCPLRVYRHIIDVDIMCLTMIKFHYEEDGMGTIPSLKGYASDGKSLLFEHLTPKELEDMLKYTVVKKIEAFFSYLIGEIADRELYTKTIVHYINNHKGLLKAVVDYTTYSDNTRATDMLYTQIEDSKLSAVQRDEKYRVLNVRRLPFYKTDDTMINAIIVKKDPSVKSKEYQVFKKMLENGTKEELLAICLTGHLSLREEAFIQLVEKGDAIAVALAIKQNMKQKFIYDHLVMHTSLT